MSVEEGPHSQSIAPAVTRIGNFVLDRSLIERSSFSKKFPIPTAIQLEFREKPFRRILGNGKEERWTYDGDYFYSGLFFLFPFFPFLSLIRFFKAIHILPKEEIIASPSLSFLEEWKHQF